MRLKFRLKNITITPYNKDRNVGIYRIKSNGKEI